MASFWPTWVAALPLEEAIKFLRLKGCCLWGSPLQFQCFRTMGSAAMPRCLKRDFAATECSSGIDSRAQKTSENPLEDTWLCIPWQPWMFISQNVPPVVGCRVTPTAAITALGRAERTESKFLATAALAGSVFTSEQRAFGGGQIFIPFWQVLDVV